MDAIRFARQRMLVGALIALLSLFSAGFGPPTLTTSDAPATRLTAAQALTLPPAPSRVKPLARS